MMKIGRESETLEFRMSETEMGKGIETISAMLNKQGYGEIYFGVSNDGTPVGITVGDETIRAFSQEIYNNIKPEINPAILVVEFEGKTCVRIEFKGGNPPYYAFDKPYVRVSTESKLMMPDELEALILRKHALKDAKFDSLPSGYRLSDMTFENLNATFKREKKKFLATEDFLSFGLCLPDGTLTNAGLLFADDSPFLQARIFCNHWNGLTKGSLLGAIDSKEFEGAILCLLRESAAYVRLHTNVSWRKLPNRRLDMPSYSERAVFEVLSNALMHRDWTIVGSEVHVDIYDDRIEVYSPGGMFDGSRIQECGIANVPSSLRNPIIAGVFSRLNFAELQGNGLKLIRDETAGLFGYSEKFAPEFDSTRSAFFVTLKDLNYKNPLRIRIDETLVQCNDDAKLQCNDEFIIAGKVLEFCSEPRSRKDMQLYSGITSRSSFYMRIMKPLLDSGQLAMTIPYKPQSKYQRYVKS
ncbi:MAG: putative DNA binding domain-containing protein [Clostridiales bacterium]|jgi:ATP-dependent DNA helicase RecG|nr:putative DNA binding domain-containing protein [Clostridiales bacterium]